MLPCEAWKHSSDAPLRWGKIFAHVCAVRRSGRLQRRYHAATGACSDVCCTRSSRPRNSIREIETMMILPTGIDRHDWATLGQDAFRDQYFLPLRPVIFTGAIDHWAANGKWTPDFFRQHHASRVVTIDEKQWLLATCSIASKPRRRRPSRPLSAQRTAGQLAEAAACGHPADAGNALCRIGSTAGLFRHATTDIHRAVYRRSRWREVPSPALRWLAHPCVPDAALRRKGISRTCPDQAKFRLSATMAPRTCPGSTTSLIRTLNGFPSSAGAGHSFHIVAGRDTVRAFRLVAHRPHPQHVDHRIDQRREYLQLDCVRERLLRFDQRSIHVRKQQCCSCT